ncbi:MAG: hypothetical protein N2513_08280 [Deltaproteobacteria bacterium]|nr:hypothetical protein [Deltaproteobacteria bacterium]
MTDLCKKLGFMEISVVVRGCSGDVRIFDKYRKETPRSPFLALTEGDETVTGRDERIQIHFLYGRGNANLEPNTRLVILKNT